MQTGLVGDGDEGFAAAGIGSGDDGDLAAEAVLGEGPGEGVLDGGEADHLAADLGEAFQAAAHEQVAFVVHADDVAGVIPAAQGLEGGVSVGVQIAAHDVGAAHEQAAALGDAFDRFEAEFEAGQEAADGAIFGGDGDVDAEAGRAFGGAVAFEEADAEFLRPGVRGGFLQFFGGGEQIAHGAEVVGIGLAAVAVEKSVGAEEDGAVAVIEGDGDDAIMERGRIEEDINAADQRQERADGEAEGVKEREAIEEAIQVREVGDSQHLANVGEEIDVRQFDALGHAFGTAGKQDDGGVLGPGIGRERGTRQPAEAGRVESDTEEGGEFPAGGDAAAQVFEEDELEAGLTKRIEIQPGAFKKGARGDDLAEAGQLAAGEHRGRAVGIIQDRRHAGDAPQAQQDDRQGADIGQEHARTGGFGCERLAQRAGQRVGAREQPAIAERLVRGVFEDFFARVLAGGGDDGGGDIGGAELHFDVELLVHHLIAQPGGQPGARGAGAEVFEDGRGEHVAEMGGDGGEPFVPSGLGREGQAGGAAEITGDDFGAGFVEEKAGTVEEFHQGAGARDAALGEKDEASAGFQMLGHAFDGVGRVGVNGEGAAVEHDFAVQPTGLGGDAGDDEFPVGIQADADEQPVEPGDVIGEEEDGALGIEDCFVVAAEAVQDSQDEPQEPGHRWFNSGTKDRADSRPGGRNAKAKNAGSSGRGLISRRAQVLVANGAVCNHRQT